ncbi:hypothetical protein P885DRAFT_61306 [Corynascus similis CBS 632.67]
MNGPLSTAELAIYAILCLPVLYLLVRHSPVGLLGWFYLLAFCTLRIVGAAVSASSAGIISSVGLSPLLLAASGILHEARFHRGRVNRGLEGTIVAAFHLFVVIAVALVGKASFGIRVFYSLVALTTRRPSLSPVTGSLAVRVVLSFLPELIATLAFVAAGMWTRNAPHSQNSNSNVVSAQVTQMREGSEGLLYNHQFDMGNLRPTSLTTFLKFNVRS